MREIKKIDPLSYAAISAVIFALLGLLGAFFVMLFGGILASAVPDGELSGAGLTGLGAMSIIVFPLIYGGIGFISGLIGSVIYNIAAKMIGGVKIQFAEDEE